MRWRARGLLAQESDAGYRVSKSRTAAGWLYAGWTPNDKPELNYWKWQETMPFKAHYKRGELVPQRTQCLGIFPSAEAARAACDAHDQQQQETIA